MRRQRGVDGRGGGDGKRFQILRRAAGRRHFRADHIHRRLAAAGAPGAFAGLAEPGGAGGDDAIAQHAGVIGAAHRAVQVNLAKPGRHVVGHHALGALQCDLGGFGAPAVRAQMIAPEQQAIDGQRGARGNLGDVGPEIHRRHARVAAKLIDLVGGRLDERVLAAAGGGTQGSFHDQRVRAAHRTDPRSAAGLMRPDQFEQCFHGISAALSAHSGCSDSSSEPASARMAPASL